jgi:hypothetical protein
MGVVVHMTRTCLKNNVTLLVIQTLLPPLPGPLMGYSGLRQGIPPGERE